VSKLRLSFFLRLLDIVTLAGGEVKASHVYHRVEGYTPMKTKRDRLSKQAEIRRLRGKVNWEGDLEAMRVTVEPGRLQPQRAHRQNGKTCSVRYP
jgi:hypothetical protein